MSLHDRMARALTRIATATSVARTRSEDATRRENHADLADRMEFVVARFESLADEMEAALDLPRASART